MKYLLCEYDRKDYTASSKARNDVIRIAKKCGYSYIPLYQSKTSKIRISYSIIKNILYTIVLAKPGDSILLQYPYQPMVVNRFILIILEIGRFIKKYSIQVLIHDISSLRDLVYDREPPQKIKNELMFFNNVDASICHNESMINVFRNNNGKGHYYNLHLFDYLTMQAPIVKNRDRNTIVIAGNLSKEKCGYIYKLPACKGIIYHLYGIGYEPGCQSGVKYFGSFDPDKIVEVLEGGFGLVWDGDSISCCNGNYGNYLKYNNPHKLSLYLAAGIPVIIWEQAALKDFVIENKIGICANSIPEACGIIEKLSDEDYSDILNNVNRIRENVIKGFYLKSILETINSGR